MLTDKLKHEQVQTDAGLVGKDTPHFEGDWKKITLAPPDANTSKDTRAELLEVRRAFHDMTEGQRKTFERQDRPDLEQEFVDLLRRLGRPVSKDLAKQISELSEELATIGLFFKLRFQRPRPNELFEAMKLKPLPEARTAKSPSYPSNHALIGAFLGDWLAEKFPQDSVALKALGKQLGALRVVGGTHFPSDVEAGRRLAEKLKSFYRGS
jgi:hypothetical protein